jgi:hypothetical protein
VGKVKEKLSQNQNQNQRSKLLAHLVSHLSLNQPATDRVDPGGNLDEVVESFSASNLDDALDMLEVVNAKTDKASVGNMASGIEKHPEVPSHLLFFISPNALTNKLLSVAAPIQGIFRSILRTRVTGAEERSPRIETSAIQGSTIQTVPEER